MRWVFQLAVAWMTCTSLAWSAEPTWLRDYQTARARAQSSGKLLLISVHTTWCGPCQAMHRTTFRDARVVARLNETCVCLSLDGDADARLVRQLPVKAYPTEIIAAADGRIVEVIEGYADAARFLATLDRARSASAVAPPANKAAPPEPTVVVGQHPKVDATEVAPVREKVIAATTPTANGLAATRSTRANPPTENTGSTNPIYPTMSPGAPLLSRTGRAPGQPGAPSEETPERAGRGAALAATAPSKPNLGGYCPVTMLERAELVRGDARFAATHGGQTYWLRSAREKSLFERDPVHYLPAAAGRCVVTWLEARESQAGRIEYPALFGDQLFLFPDSAHRDKFLRDPERYVSSARSLLR